MRWCAAILAVLCASCASTGKSAESLQGRWVTVDRNLQQSNHPGETVFVFRPGGTFELWAVSNEYPFSKTRLEKTVEGSYALSGEDLVLTHAKGTTRLRYQLAGDVLVLENRELNTRATFSRTAE